MFPELHIFTLPNGMRVVHQPVKSAVAHCGVMISAGTRDEEEHEHGLAHYIEHCVFKGTEKRKTFHILSRLDAVGGELNAYTTKEETAIHASFPREYYHRTIELLSDVVFHSVFPPKEIEKEKEVIYDEIHSYLDDPSEQIFDDFENHLFRDHPLGRDILGTPESLKALTRNDILKFIRRNYQTENMIISSVGQIEPWRLKKLLERYFGEVRTEGEQPPRSPFKHHDAFNEISERSTYQAHCVMGAPAYSALDEKRKNLALLNNLLGGPPMNTRLGMEIREKRGIAYTIESSFHPYTDTGWLNIYFGTSNKNLNKTIRLVHKELRRFREQRLGERQLSMAKKQLCGLVAMAAENNASMMLSNAKSLMLYDTIDTLEATYEKIHSITADDLLETANELLTPDKISVLAYKGT